MREILSRSFIRGMGKENTIAILYIVFICTLACIGSYYYITPISYGVIFLALIPIIFIRQIPSSCYPLYLYGISLALLWQTSMLGNYIVGNDIFGELKVVRYVIENGFSTNIDGGNDTVFSTTILSPTLASWGISPVFQFKVLYPMWFAITPVVIYFVFKRYFSTQISFLNNQNWMLLQVIRRMRIQIADLMLI